MNVAFSIIAILGMVIIFYSVSVINDKKTEHADLATELELERGAVLRLDGATDWLVIHGPTVLEDAGPDILKKQLIDEWSVNLWVTPRSIQHGEADFRVKARRINYDIMRLQVIDKGDYDIEQWVTQISAAEWILERPSRRFHLVERRDDETATILAQSESYVTAFGNPSLFPEIDLGVL